MEGYVVMPRDVQAQLSAVTEANGSSSSSEQARKKARVDGSGTSAGPVVDAVAVTELTAASLEAALHSGGYPGVTVQQAFPSPTKDTDVYTLRTAAVVGRLPRQISLGGTSLHVFVDRAAKSSQLLNSSSSPSSAVDGSYLSRPLLLVGAGGIGCELLKVLVLSGFNRIEVIDLDTIDATNLNRQFLFTTVDVGMPKATTARAAVLRWFDARRALYPQFAQEPWAAPPTIVAHHENVKDEGRFDEDYYSRFAAVLNALDNVSARQHVNRMCMKTNVPLFESGTMGYNGQVQPIVKGCFECYDCHPKPADQKTFAVCTIHARPTTMVHCVHFAKELYETLFGERSLVKAQWALSSNKHSGTNGTGNGGNVEQQGGTKDAGELAYLKDVVAACMASGPAAPSSFSSDNEQTLRQLGSALARCLFNAKINELLAMKSVWSTEPPVALDVTLIDRTARRPLSAARAILRDAPLTVEENVQLFLYAAAECCRRLLQREVPATTGNGHSTSTKDENEGAVFQFKKEDDLAVVFVAATANLRAHAFHIAENSVEALRTIAGAIVPAIATTNAMVAAGVVQQLVAYYHAIKHTEGNERGASSLPLCNMIYVRKAPLMKRRRPHATPALFGETNGTRGGSNSRRGAIAAAPVALVTDRYLMHSVVPSTPNRCCRVCTQHGAPTVRVSVPSLQSVTLGRLVSEVLEGLLGMECPSVVVDARIVYDEEDYEELIDSPLATFAKRKHDGEGGETLATATATFLVDALNKHVEWRVLVVAASDAVTESSSPTAGDAADGFTISGLADALVAEKAAEGAREAKTAAEAETQRAEEQQQQQKDREEGEEEGAAAGGTVDNAIDLDSDAEEEIEGRDTSSSIATNGGTKVNSAGGGGHATEKDEEVIEID